MNNWKEDDWINDSCKKTEIPEAYKEDFHSRLDLSKYNDKGKFKASYAKKDPLVFARYVLGINSKNVGFEIRPYQGYFIDQVLENKRVALVKSRQIGMSTTLGIFALWLALYNKLPVGLHNSTNIGLISKDDDSSKSLMRKYVKGFLPGADRWMKEVTGGATDFISRRVGKINNTSQIEFDKTVMNKQNGSMINCYPPTEKAVGETLSALFIDEAALLNNPNPKEWLASILPTVSSNGLVVLSSTPRNASGLFYEAIDPFEKRKIHNYKRLFYPFTINKNDEEYMQRVYNSFRNMDKREFAREYECNFITSGDNFFSPILVDRAMDDRVRDSYDFKGEVVAGIDFGWTDSRTVVTLTWKDPSDDIIKLIHIKRFDSKTVGDSVFNHLEFLENTYNIVSYVVDDCTQGKDFVDKLKKKGKSVIEFDFHTHKGDKISTYIKFKSKMNNGFIKFPENRILIREMKELLSEETRIGKPSIHKPRRGSDDIIDSFVMSTFPFLNENNAEEYDSMLF